MSQDVARVCQAIQCAMQAVIEGKDVGALLRGEKGGVKELVVSEVDSESSGSAGSTWGELMDEEETRVQSARGSEPVVVAEPVVAKCEQPGVVVAVRGASDSVPGVVGDSQVTPRAVTFAEAAQVGAKVSDAYSVVKHSGVRLFRKFLRSKGVAVPVAAERDLAIVMRTKKCQPVELHGASERLQCLAMVGDSALRTALFVNALGAQKCTPADMQGKASKWLNNAELSASGARAGLYKHLLKDVNEDPEHTRVGADMVEALAGLLMMHTSVANLLVYMRVLGLTG